MGHPRRDLLPGRRLARRRLPRRSRGLLLPSQLRRHVAVPVRRRPRPGRRGHLRAATRDLRTSQHHRRVPAPDRGRHGLQPGRPLAAGVPLRHRPVQIDRLRVLCRDADARRAHLRISTRIDSDRLTPVTMRTYVDGVQVDEQLQSIAAGQNDFEWTIDISDPALWWPRALGDQPLIDVAVEVVVDGEVSDRRQRRTGLRQVVWDDWICSVNGERLFLKGANILPTTAGPANATDEMIRADLRRSGRPRPRRAARARPHRRPRAVQRGRRSGNPAPAGLPAAVGPRTIGSTAGRRAGPRRRRRTRAPSVDRDVDRPRRPGGHRRWRHRSGVARSGTNLGGQTAAVVEQVGARPVGEASVRTRRLQSAGRGPLGSRPASPAARRHRQPPVVRMAPRRGGGPRGLRLATATHGALRQRVRVGFAAPRRTVHRRTTGRVRVAEPRLGPRRDDEGLPASGHRAELRADGLRQLRGVA